MCSEVKVPGNLKSRPIVCSGWVCVHLCDCRRRFANDFKRIQNSFFHKPWCKIPMCSQVMFCLPHLASLTNMTNKFE